MAIHFYSAGVKVDSITLLNHLGFSVSYKTFQKSFLI